MFEKYSWFFRNALVRANYRNVKNGVEPDSSFLIAFLCNLLLGESNPLHNRNMLVGTKGNLFGKTEQVKTTNRTSAVQVENPLLKGLNDKIKALIQSIGNDMLSVKEMMEGVSLSHRPTFLENYLDPALAERFVTRLYPDSPRHPRQRYLLTVRGQAILQLLK